MSPRVAAHLGTCRHNVRWNITLRHGQALASRTQAGIIWQTSALHMVSHAPLFGVAAKHSAYRRPADDSGATLVLILDWAGPVITTFLTLRCSEALLRGPVRATLDVKPRGKRYKIRECLAQTVLRWLLGGFASNFDNIDQQQRALLTAMTDSDAAAHVIHALAGCGQHDHSPMPSRTLRTCNAVWQGWAPKIFCLF